MLKALTKNQTLKAIYTELLEEEDSKLWQYFASVVIKHALKAGSLKEQQDFALWAKNENNEAIEKFLESKINIILPDVTHEIKQFRQRVNQKIKKLN